MESLIVYAESAKIEALKAFLKSVGIRFESPVKEHESDKVLFLNELGQSVQELNEVLTGQAQARDAYQLLEEL